MAPDSDENLTDAAVSPDQVVIRAKRLDADESQEVAIEVEIPATEAGQRAQLTEMVHARYPEAEFRSFADDAASFLAHKVLIVAVYCRSTREKDPGRGIEDDPPRLPQQQLFAA